MFSKEVYKKHNGKIFLILAGITFVFFLIIIWAIFSPNPIEYPKFLEQYAEILSMTLGFLAMIGFVGFPLSLCLYKGMKNLYVKSTLYIKDKKIVYDKQAEFEWSAVGQIDEKHIFSVNKIDKYEITNRWIKIEGNIEKTVINKKRHLNTKNINSVKIARAFDTDEKIINFLNKCK